MFISCVAINNQAAAMAIAKLNLANTTASIIGLDTVKDNVCEYVVFWLEGPKRIGKQALINTVYETFEVLTECHPTAD